MKCFLKQGLLCSSLVIGLFTCFVPAFAIPLAPVSALTLTPQDQQALRAALPSERENVTALIWQGDPLLLTLPLNQETRLIFSEPVQVDVNGQLTTEQLRIINNHQNLYLTALQPFAPQTRLYVTLKNSGQIIFLDISTSEKNEKTQPSKAHPAIHIRVSPALQRSAQSMTFKKPDLTDSLSPSNTTTNYVSDSPFFSASADNLEQIVRFAWRQLYAPSYWLSNDLGFMRAPMHTLFWTPGLFYSDTVFAHPLAAWTRDEFYITAIELRNPYPHSTSLDLTRDLCGHWRAAMLYPRTRLQPAGQKPADGTTLFLISSEPFDHVFHAGGCDHGRV